MNFRSTPVKIALAVAAALGLSMTAVPTVTAQERALAPQVTVTPSTNLPATADVEVQVTGFEPEEAVFIQQCAQVTPGVFGCDYGRTQSMTLGEEGAGTARVTVHRVFEAHDDSGDSLGTVDCNTVESGCLIAVGNVEGGSQAAISFTEDA
ncbi:enediyne antibiotic chromoprotein [Streptomyces sp. NPDC058685]|uniref:enediyne antibiotic chromoprotein n=1 Tax=Streptomyces sp. NPDC058685 TaxID=3346598 RepID=UPI0036576FEE